MCVCVCVCVYDCVYKYIHMNQVQLLCGTSETIVDRTAVFGEALDERAPFPRDSVIGSLVFFCGGVCV